MFAYYGRRETSYVDFVVCNSAQFQITKDNKGCAMGPKGFARYLQEEEFLLLVEIDKRGAPTGNEATLFVEKVYGNHAEDLTYLLAFVDENPDEFWNKRKLGV